MDVFISYRRDGGYAFARLLYECLHKENISAFLDLEELRSGPFNEKLYAAIEDSENFVVVLPPNALDRCASQIAKEVVAFCNEHYDELNEQFFSSETLFSSGYIIYSVKF